MLFVMTFKNIFDEKDTICLLEDLSDMQSAINAANNFIKVKENYQVFEIKQTD